MNPKYLEYPWMKDLEPLLQRIAYLETEVQALKYPQPYLYQSGIAGITTNTIGTGAWGGTGGYSGTINIPNTGTLPVQSGSSLTNVKK